MIEPFSFESKLKSKYKNNIPFYSESNITGGKRGDIEEKDEGKIDFLIYNEGLQFVEK